MPKDIDIDLDEDFDDKCNELGGKIDVMEKPKMKVCLIKGMAITEGGEVLPYGEPKKQ